jgi:probable rRNA maturation factor
MINVTIRPEFEDQVSPHELERAARTTLCAEAVPGEAELSIVITNDDEIKTLNRQFRNQDTPTDVLAFADDGDDAFVTTVDPAPYLGDVIISWPRAQAQASERGHATQHELHLLVVHGVLHLLGYDHATREQKADMWARQDAILNTLAGMDYG